MVVYKYFYKFAIERASLKGRIIFSRYNNMKKYEHSKILHHTDATTEVTIFKVVKSLFESTANKIGKKALTGGGIIDTTQGATTFCNVTFNGNTIRKNSATPYRKMRWGVSYLLVS